MTSSTFSSAGPRAASSGMPRTGAPPRPLQALNWLDRVVLALDEVMRQKGGAGFETQAMLWFAGRLNRERLRLAVRRLAVRYPVLTARLVVPATSQDPYWCSQPNASLTIDEVALESAAPDALHQLAAAWLATPRDLASSGPVSFHLVHLGDGRDVLILQYNHVLMDIHALAPLFDELDHLGRSDTSEAASLPWRADEDSLELGRRRLPWRERLTSVLYALDVQFRQLRLPVVTLGRPCAVPPAPYPYHFRSLSFDAAAVGALTSRLARCCGLASLSMGLVASAFRAFLQTERLRPDHELIVGLGVDLGLRRPGNLELRNLVSIVPLQALTSELGERDELVRILTARLRERVRHHHDWGFIQLGTVLRKNRQLLARCAHGIVTEGLSFWFAYFSALDALPSTFLGASVEDLQLSSACCPPAGLSLVTHKFRGKLTLQATYMPTSVSDAEVEAFLGALVEDAFTA